MKMYWAGKYETKDIEEMSREELIGVVRELSASLEETRAWGLSGIMTMAQLAKHRTT